MKEAKEKALEILHHEAKMAKSMPRYSKCTGAEDS